MSEHLTQREEQPANIQEWSDKQLVESYLYLEGLSISEMNAACMLDLAAEMKRRELTDKKG